VKSGVGDALPWRRTWAFVAGQTITVVGVVLVVASCGLIPARLPSAGQSNDAAGGGKSAVTLAIGEEPANASIWRPLIGLGGQLERDLWSDPLTWYDAQTRELKPTGLTDHWEQMADNRWRFYLRPGVKFHNGEPWNAQAAAFGLSIMSDPATGHESYQYAGPLTGEPEDDLTLDIVCPAACPILPRQLMQTVFEAPEWWKNASPEERETKTVSTGPYKFVEWKKGEYIKSTAYEDYVPAPDVPEMQKPRVKDVTLVWRGEPSVLASLVKTGQADMAWDIGTEARDLAPATKSGGTTSIFAFTMDTIWHPELKKLKVRQAIAHAVNCPNIVNSIYAGQTECRGNIAFPGVLGITDDNVKPYTYDPNLSKQLLSEAGYNPANVITINVRSGRTPKGEEVGEAIQGYLTAVGINAQLKIIETAVYNTLTNCGIGKKGASAASPAPDCAGADMIGYNPNHDDMEYSRQISKRMSCTSIQGFFCDPNVIQPELDSLSTYSGDERAKVLSSLADFVHDQVIFLPIHQVFVTYAVTPSLVWEPRYDGRIRVNTMSFK
jgi:peptide/nickel transport system substrate-binding protein